MRLLILASTLMVASCAAVPPPRAAIGPRECGVTASSDWAAWVNAMPGPNAKPTLIVTGKITVPTGGYRFEWRDVRVMESYPVQVAVELEAIRPTDAATQAVVTRQVRGEWPIDPPVGSLTVHCGDTVLARISPVETAH